MKAKPITHNGINFRSKLEGRWYNFFTEECKFEVEYEPDVEGVRGYIPDFKIKGRLYDIFVEVKPFESLDDWYEDTQYEDQKIKLNNSNLIKIEHSPIDYFNFNRNMKNNLEKIFNNLSGGHQMMAHSSSAPNPFVLNYTNVHKDQVKDFFNLMIKKIEKNNGGKIAELFFGKDWRDYTKSSALTQLGFLHDPKKEKNKRILLVVGSQIPQCFGKDKAFGCLYPITDKMLEKDFSLPLFFVNGFVSGSDFRSMTDYYNTNYVYDFSTGPGTPFWGQIVSGQFWNAPEIDDKEFKKSLPISWNKSWSKLQWTPR
jgi:hypothetical protein